MVTAVAAATVPLDVRAQADALRRRIAGMRRKRFLVTGYDGTLAPIVDVPALAALPPEVRQLLRALAAAGVVTIVVSGRAIDDLQPRLGLPLICAGNHGLEIRGGGLEYTVPAARELRFELLRAANQLRSRLARFVGALVECKGLSATVHFRQVAAGDVAAVAGVVRTILENHPGFRVRAGRQSFEICPDVGWNKGLAARWILEQLGGEAEDTISIGDDSSDEDLFRELRDGITVHVGNDGSSAAKYWAGAGETTALLRFVCETVNEVTYGEQGIGRAS